METLNIPFAQLLETFERILIQNGFDEDSASLSAGLFARSSLDGVPSHGLNRFPSFIKMVREGLVDVKAKPSLSGSFGFLKQQKPKIKAQHLASNSSLPQPPRSI